MAHQISLMSRRAFSGFELSPRLFLSELPRFLFLSLSPVVTSSRRHRLGANGSVCAPRGNRPSSPDHSCVDNSTRADQCRGLDVTIHLQPRRKF